MDVNDSEVTETQLFTWDEAVYGEDDVDNIAVSKPESENIWEWLNGIFSVAFSLGRSVTEVR